MSVKTLGTLIRIHKQKADLLRREMVLLEEEMHQLEMLADKLRRQHDEEIALVANDPAYASFFGPYSVHTKKKLAAIAEEIKQLLITIEEKRQKIADEFSEQKKYEIVQDNLKKRLLEQEKHRQMSRFDEIASQQYMRHKENPA